MRTAIHISVSSLLSDLRHAWRVLVRRPSFSTSLVLVLALGIGGTTAMFSLLEGVLLRPLPFPHPDQLVTISGAANPPSGDPLAWWGQNDAFESLAVYQSGGVNLTGGERPERVSAAVVSSSFFGVLRAKPLLGRPFLPEEEVLGRNTLAVLSYGFWHRQFGRAPGILGRTVTLNGVPHTVVGVMPSGFVFPGRTDVWVPRAVGARSLDLGPVEQTDLPEGLAGAMIGRLRAGVSMARANAELKTLLRRLSDTYTARTGTHFGEYVVAIPLQERFVRGFRPAVLTLFVAMLLVLVIVCANVASALLARAVARQKEVAVRLCLGASRWRIVRQLLTESTLLALVGGGAGTLLALWAVEGIRSIGPADIPRLAEMRVDPGALAFALGVSVLTGVLLGLAPAFQASTTDLTPALKEEGPRSTGRLGQRVRSILVIAEVAIGLVLLTGAGLMIQTFRRLTQVEPGFNPHNVVTMELALPAARYRPAATTNRSLAPGDNRGPSMGGRVPTEPQLTKQLKPLQAQLQQPGDYPIVAFHQRLSEVIGGLPGVVAVGAVSKLPLSAHVGGYLWFGLGGKMAGEALYLCVSGQYFRALGIPLLAGRSFTDRDARDAPKVIVINQTFAQRFWGEKNTVGQVLPLDGEEGGREIVGVVGDIKFSGLGEAPEPQMYLPYTQPYGNSEAPLSMTFVVRTTSDPKNKLASLRSQVLAVDDELPVFHVKTMDEVISDSTGPPRFRSLLLGLFAFLALVLAMLGVYGVVAYSAACRTHEIGVRMSMGAYPRDIVLLFLGQGVRLALAGVAVGLILALVLNRLISGLLFGVSGRDPATFVLSGLLLFGAALAASLVPAIRASKLDPVVALRYE